MFDLWTFSNDLAQASVAKSTEVMRIRGVENLRSDLENLATRLSSTEFQEAVISVAS